MTTDTQSYQDIVEDTYMDQTGGPDKGTATEQIRAVLEMTSAPLAAAEIRGLLPHLGASTVSSTVSKMCQDTWRELQELPPHSHQATYLYGTWGLQPTTGGPRHYSRDSQAGVVALIGYTVVESAPTGKRPRKAKKMTKQPTQPTQKKLDEMVARGTIPADPGPTPPEPERPLMIFEVYPDHVRISHELAAELMEAMND